MKVIVSTSDNYHHILPVFFYLFGKYWRDEMVLVGYKKPSIELPEYCEWVSLGVQGDRYGYGKDMRTFFQTQPDTFVYIMEDTFVKQPLKRDAYELCKALSIAPDVGRISLTNNSYKYYDRFVRNIQGVDLWRTPDDSDYRASLQPAIWRREYLCKFLKDGYSPWMMENDNGTLMTYSETEYINIKIDTSPLVSNEGIRRHNLNMFDFTGMSEEDLQQLKLMGYVNNPWRR